MESFAFVVRKKKRANTVQINRLANGPKTCLKHVFGMFVGWFVWPVLGRFFGSLFEVFDGFARTP